MAHAAHEERPGIAYHWQSEIPASASLPRRGLALLVDLLVSLVLAYAVALALAAAGLLTVPEVSLAGVERSQGLGFLWLVSLLELPVNLVYFTVLEGTLGQTIGKVLLGLRVRSLKGDRVTPFDAFLRNLLRLLWVTPFGAGFILVDLYVIHVTEVDQRIGDLAAGTVVVDESEESPWERAAPA